MDKVIKSAEINLLEMLKYILSKWIILCVVGILVAVAFCAMKFYSIEKASRVAPVESLFAKMNFNDKIQAEKYETMLDVVREWIQMRNTDIRMEMNPQAVDMVEILWYIKADSSAQTCANTYASMLGGAELSNFLEEYFAGAYTQEECAALVTYSSVAVNSGKREDAKLDENCSDIMRFSMYVPDNQGEQLVEAIHVFIQKKGISVNRTIGEHAFVYLSEQVPRMENKEILQYQENVTKQVSAKLDELMAIRGQLSQDAVKYLKNKHQDDADFGYFDNVDEVLEPALSVKNIVIGIVLGIVLAGAFFGGWYVLSPKMINANAFGDRYVLTSFGVVQGAKVEQVERICNNIAVFCKRNGIVNVGLVSSLEGIRTNELVASFNGRLSNNGIEIVSMGSLVRDADMLAKCSEAGNVILIEKVGTSKYKEINLELEKAEVYAIDVIGSVLI